MLGLGHGEDSGTYLSAGDATEVFNVKGHPISRSMKPMKLRKEVRMPSVEGARNTPHTIKRYSSQVRSDWVYEQPNRSPNPVECYQAHSPC